MAGVGGVVGDAAARIGKLDSTDRVPALAERDGHPSIAAGLGSAGSQTLAKGLMLLELVADRQGGYGVGLVELARELGWNKSTTHRLLATLVALGYAQQDPESGWYRIGLKAFQLGAAYSRDLDLRREAASILIDLQQETDQGVSLVVLDVATREVVYIDRVESSHHLRMHTPIGMRFPWNCTAAGKAIMAFLPEIEAKPLLASDLPRRTSNSINIAKALRAQFLRVRASGYATDTEENTEGVRCVAAPVFDSAGRVIGAISISGHSGQIAVKRFSELGTAVRKAADRVSRRLGYKGV
jgi:DNA-binding IclR family transcriptional regulator